MKNTQYLIGSILFFVMPLSGFAANVITTWSGGSSGTSPWETSGNWSSGIPQNGTNLYQAVIGDSTGNRVITTSSNITVSRLQITQSTATSGAGTTLQLGGDFLVNGNSISGFTNTAFTNSTGDASKLVIDLAGHNFSVASTVSFSSLASASNFTIMSSGNSGGVYAVREVTSSGTNVQVKNNATVELTEASVTQNLTGYTFSSSSTLWLSATGNYTSFRSATVGSLLVGDPTAAGPTTATITSGIRTQGSVTLSTYTGATGGDASLLALNGQSLFVGGAFTDQGSNSANYGSGTIIFTGNPSSAQTVSIQRQALINNFQVGENASNLGNIALATNLTTSGTFSLLAGSRLNALTHKVQAGAVTVGNAADLAITFGLNSGSITSTGALTLNDLNLALTYDGSGWTNGSNLVLFSYAGAFTGSPMLDSLIGTGFTYGSLVNDPVLKEIYLSDVSITAPEPRSVALLIFGGGFFLLVSRRRWSLRY